MKKPLRSSERAGNRPATPRSTNASAWEAPRSHAPKWAGQFDALFKQLVLHKVEIAENARERLLDYCRAVEAQNLRASLVSPHDVGDLVEKHVATSLGPLWRHPPGPDQVWVDLGTGGGLPGMVIKLARPDLPMTLVDSSRKKTAFLDHLKTRMRIEGLKIHPSRIETLTSQDLEGWSPLPEASHVVILMRAVAPLDRALPLLEGFASPGTVLMTFKGPCWSTALEASRPVLAKYGWIAEETVQIPWAAPKLLYLRRS